MFKKTKVCTGVLAALGGFALIAPLAVQAQDAQRIEVTGSRIKTIGAVSSSPITSVTAAEINTSAPIAVEEVIKSLPAAIPAIGPGTNNGSGGGATIDLRGLGTNRTLVLINGRRMVPFNLGGVVDTNSIPVALLERIDLVTGGASAVYGADAVSGVVNFVLRKNFNGVDFSSQYGISEEGDAKRYRTDLTVGANLADGRGNVVLSLGTSRTNALRQGERTIGLVSRSSVTGAAQGSGTATPAQFLSIPGLGTQQIDPATGGFVAPVGYNFNPLNYYETPLERTQATVLSRYSINDNLEVYADVGYTKSNVTLNLAPSGTFFNRFNVPIGNPFIPALARQQLCTAYNIAAANCVAGDTTTVPLDIGRRFTEMGPRINTFDNSTLQWTAGVRGAMPYFSNWSYDVYLTKGTAEQLSVRQDWGSLSKVQQALNAVNANACVNPANGCVPLNVFGGDGSITQAMINFINLSSVQTTTVRQSILNGSLAGDLGAFKSPLAKTPISLVLGVEQREVFGGNRSDAPAQIAGEVLGSGAPTPDRAGVFKLDESYVEMIAPLVQNLPGVQNLSLELGYRNTDFKTAAGSQSYGSWKAGADYTPFRGLRVRMMQQRATRAPNVNELYAPVITGLSNLTTDPCGAAAINQAEANTPGTLSNLCRATGVPLAQVGVLPQPSAGQINNTGGGNPNLGPEEADTTTLGFVFEPDFVRGLSITLDWWQIKIKKAVSSATALQVVNGCYSASLNPTRDPNAVFCGLIRRGPSGTFNGTGALGVITQSSNLGYIESSGVDLGVNYRLNLQSWGRVDIGLQAAQTDKWTFQSLPTLAPIDCLGYYGTNCGGPTFKTKWTQRTQWNVGDFTVGYTWRYQGKVIEEPAAGTATFLPAYASIPAYNYVDLNASWKPTKNVTLGLVITNANGKDAPDVGNTIATTTTNSGNTFPQWYDVIGRRYSLSARVQF